ncbi:hypothetical protein BC834DRAFT_168844 [Gloeopeniophorella convolvens]|nr:hypothetical protein BC834DRAFT_168844 [Gloeopeniophorella convolvens]
MRAKTGIWAPQNAQRVCCETWHQLELVAKDERVDAPSGMEIQAEPFIRNRGRRCNRLGPSRRVVPPTTSSTFAPFALHCCPLSCTEFLYRLGSMPCICPTSQSYARRNLWRWKLKWRARPRRHRTPCIYSLRSVQKVSLVTSSLSCRLCYPNRLRIGQSIFLSRLRLPENLAATPTN